MMFAMEVRRYLTRSGKDVFGEWLAALKDVRTQARIVPALIASPQEISATAKPFVAAYLDCGSTGAPDIASTTRW